MIKIKTFSIRQAIERVCFYITVFGVIFLIILFSLLISYFIKEEFEKNNSQNDVSFSKRFSKTMIVNSVLDNELLLFSLRNNNLKSVLDNSSEIIQASSFKSSDVTEKTNENSLVVDIKKIPENNYMLPNKFDSEVFEDGKVRIGKTKITNYSKLKLNIDELSKPAQLKLDYNTDFLIFHTHATESYLTNSTAASNYRSLDEKFNMLEIGRVLSEELAIRGFGTLQDRTLHDYPSYNGAYKNSLETVNKYLKLKNYEFILDVHRDAVSSDLTYGPICNINGERAAKLMFVIGTNASGLKHDNWFENLRMAITIQNRAEEMYPGLFRDINLSSSRYNAHVGTGAFIIEVGTTGNSLDEARIAMKYLANVMESFK